jgi:hypothetical protein
VPCDGRVWALLIPSSRSSTTWCSTWILRRTRRRTGWRVRIHPKRRASGAYGIGDPTNLITSHLPHRSTCLTSHRSDALFPLSLSPHLSVGPQTSRTHFRPRLGRDAARGTNRDGVATDGALCRLDQAQKLLRENGGRIVDDIHHPKLTHIVMDDDDSGRYGELVRKTAKWVRAGRSRRYFYFSSRRSRVLPLV